MYKKRVSYGFEANPVLIEENTKIKKELKKLVAQTDTFKNDATLMEQAANTQRQQLKAQYPEHVSYPNIGVSIETEMDPSWTPPSPITVSDLRPDHPQVQEVNELERKAKALRDAAIELEKIIASIKKEFRLP